MYNQSKWYNISQFIYRIPLKFKLIILVVLKFFLFKIDIHSFVEKVK